MAGMRILFQSDTIARRLELLAAEIAAAMGDDLTIVGILNGSFVFIADLARALDRQACAPRIDFIRLSSYGQRQRSSGKIELIGQPPPDLDGRQVLLVDDVVDSGRSMRFACKLLRQGAAAEVLTCALLDKPARREVDMVSDFLGFTIPDVFVVGYGIDYAGEHRHLPYISALS
ncbi:MAG: hypoxanthine phosphoribosyltransferase [Alphaproteobacteria bacterium]|jgi:hypoxanthine phosphoribosyltransferase|nr:hypoxanthine phosphoribosyltransferase [Alphaproteobacteria bacterium]MDP6621149.1 hypoxanthine phosphoribosyltransferase [Alphaproteobacteria bacterium]|tara:strand:- start:988 stop:1509 length:522 start_codon:yes stop_codon:yes gene_type:complete